MARQCSGFDRCPRIAGQESRVGRAPVDRRLKAAVPSARAVEFNLEIAGKDPAILIVGGGGHRHKGAREEPAGARVVTRQQLFRFEAERAPVTDPTEFNRRRRMEWGRIGQRHKPRARTQKRRDRRRLAILRPPGERRKTDGGQPQPRRPDILSQTKDDQRRQ